jgi:hypothetical protein
MGAGPTPLRHRVAVHAVAPEAADTDWPENLAQGFQEWLPATPPTPDPASRIGDSLAGLAGHRKKED